MISFAISKEDHMKVMRLVDRPEALSSKFGRKLDRRSLVMDLTACIANGTPLKLDDLLIADDGNFAHDVFGIARHIDRQTGQLGDCFLPRYAAL